MKIPISDISVNPGRREAQPKQVEKLVRSMGELGLLNPITIDEKHTLIAGLHRLEAAKLLGWEEIECTISNLVNFQAELAEIDENFVRRNLSDMEYNDLLLRRKKVYEILHPETKQGKRNGKTHKTDTGSVLCSKPFSQDTAETLSVSPRTVERKVQIAKNLTPKVKEIVDKNGIGFRDSLKLARLDPSKQEEAANLIVSKKKRSKNEHLPTQQEEPAEQDTADGHQQEVPDEAEPDAHTSAAGETIRGTALFREIVSDMKNADKDFSCTPDSFLAEIVSFVQNFQKELDWYNTPYYEAVYPALTPEQFQEFRREMDTICTAVQNLIHHVEVNVK